MEIQQEDENMTEMHIISERMESKDESAYIPIGFFVDEQDRNEALNKYILPDPTKKKKWYNSGVLTLPRGG